MLLEEICRTLDSLDAMQHALSSEGVTVEGSAGQPRAHPVLVELRQQRVALGRMLSQLALPDEETGAGLPSLTEARARRAANARWRPHRVKGSADGPA